ncbi:pyridoxamine 5'-phosphate oxidase family protein [Nonomuraea sp. B12E4]|uniref:pyridoxamine 5'-phosphate oxidase family protein n=1 Tax=Nonomuraea sp. B12E4 TaxID=3153564 RepID=UPI00325D6A2B
MHPRDLKELSTVDSLRRLASVPIGRIVFTRNALPAIRPVNHIVTGGQIVIRSGHSAILSVELAAADVVVAFEADDLDIVERLGWSVVVTGRAQLVSRSEEVARYKDLLQPWVAGEMDQVIRIRPEIITGFELVPVH